MNLTVQPNFYSKTTGLKRNQQNKNNQSFSTNQLRSRQIAFKGAEPFDVGRDYQEQLNKRTGLQKFLGLGKETAMRTTLEKAKVHIAYADKLQSDNDRLVSEQLQNLHLKEELLRKEEEKTQILRDKLASEEKNTAKYEQIIKDLSAQNEKLAKERSSYNADLENFNKSKNVEEEITKRKAGHGWERVAGNERHKVDLDQKFMKWLALEQGGVDVKMPNGILFYGPQSTGKTLFARAFAQQSGCNYHEVIVSNPDDNEILADLMKAANKSKELYENSPDKKRTIILLDEFDAIANVPKDEAGKTIKNSTSIVPKLKSFLESCSEKYKCTVFMTTNYPLNLDTELLAPHRTPMKVYLGPPEKEDAAEIFKFYLKGATEQVIDHNKLADTIITKASESGKAFSAGLIELISTESIRLANEAKQKLTENDILKNIRNAEPDISKIKLEKFAETIEEIGKIGKRFL